MSTSNQRELPPFPERDEYGGDELPTYDDLAAQHGRPLPYRFGRWRSWIEKRAAERYVDLTPEELQRRRARGWGEGVSPTLAYARDVYVIGLCRR